MSKADWLRLIVLSLLWGGSFLFVGMALAGGMPPLLLVWCRVGFGAAVLAAVLMLVRTPFPHRQVWPALLGMGLLNNVIPFTLFAFAQGEIGAGLAAILNAMTPLFTVLVGHVLLAEERMTGARVAGVVLGFAGVMVMMRGEGFGGTLLAKLACLGAALSYAFAGIWGRRFKRSGLSPMAVAFGQCAFAAAMLGPVVLLVDRPWLLPLPEGRVILAIAGLVLLSTALAYLLFFRLLASAGALNVQLVTFLIPVSAVLLGALFLDEALEKKHLAGAALIAAGLVAIDGRVWRWLRADAR